MKVVKAMNLSPDAIGLSEGSPYYASKVDVYELLSLAEDAPGYVFEYVSPLLKGKKILDLACGTGKYCQLFSVCAKAVVGVDNSRQQLELAKLKVLKKPNVILKCASAKRLPFEDDSFEVIFSSWFLGVIKSDEEKLQILRECKRVLRPNGKMIFVENGEGGTFERIRGRVNDPLERTKKYNEFLLRNGFKMVQEIESFFSFKTKKEAVNIISDIWGEQAGALVVEAKINHKINLFLYESP